MCAAFTTATPSPATPDHIPVLLAEVIEALAPKAEGVYLDGTFGAGGYTVALLEAAPCVVWSIDRDPEALQRGATLLERFPGRINLVQGRFGDMAELLSARYEAAIEESRAGRSDDAERILVELVKDAPDGYKLLSRFRLAAETGKADPAKSIAAYDVLAADGSLPVLLRDIARYRAAVLASGQIDAKALAARLEPLTAKPGSMTGLAQELLGLSAMQAGDYDQAGRLFDAITIDRTSPQSLRQRVEIYLGLIRGGPVQSSS
jgi:hypothetical protein